MKSKNLLLIAVAAAGLAMVSCESSTKLAKDVAGTWTGDVAHINDNSLNSDIFSTYTLNYDSESATPGGDIVINSTISSSYSGQLMVGETAENVTMNVAGTSKVTGTWTAIDDDEIVITLNPSSLEVTIDPDSQALVASVTGVNGEVTDTLSPYVARVIKDRLSYDLRIKYSSAIHMDDVKVVNGNTLKYEIDDIDYVMTAE